MKFSVLTTIFILGAVDANAGMTTLNYTIVNTGMHSISCEATLAHWYSDHLTDIAPKQSRVFTLWVDAQDGTVYRLNQYGERMPVERVWCGQKSNSWVTRFEILLPRRIGDAVHETTLQCHTDNAKTVCVTP